MRHAVAAMFVGLALTPPAAAGHKDEPPALTAEHEHPSGAFTFRTPGSWKVGPVAGKPDAFDAVGDGVRVRFLFRWGEVGYDGLHVDCMLERLAAPMDMQPRVKYEYDFLSSTFGAMRALDSAFVVEYDAPVAGARQWRQRNLTLVGSGQSLCLITYVPLEVWKKDKKARALVDAVVASVTLRPAPQP